MSSSPRTSTRTSPVSPRSAWLSRATTAALLFVALLGACCSDEKGSSSWNAGGSGAAGAEAVVAGTVLDAASGEPVPNVKVHGPRDTSSRTDGRGRFRLTGLRAGDQGEVHAETSDGRSGRLVLRKLAGGELEVVLHLTRTAEK